MERMVLATLTMLLAARYAGPPDPRRTYAGGGKDAVLMLPADAVCGGDVKRLVWTPDGRSLIVIRHTFEFDARAVQAFAGGPKPTAEEVARMRPRDEVLVWNVASRQARLAFSLDEAQGRIGYVAPLAGSDRLVVETTGERPGPEGAPVPFQNILLLAPGAGNPVLLGTNDGSSFLGFTLSPSRPIGYLSSIDYKTRLTTARLFGPSGRLSPVFTTPKGVGITYNANGDFGLFDDSVPTKKGASPMWRRLDPATAALGPLVPFVFTEVAIDEDPNALKVVDAKGTVEDATAPGLFLHVPGGKPGESGVLTTDGSQAELSPKENAVAYVSGETVMVRRLVRVPRKAFDDARLAALKAAAVNNAKQAALGLLMYSADYDDNYPSQGDYTKIAPYLKNDAIMNSFSYTFHGGNAVDIEKPAETELGYVPGPGGRAVAYADGHVKWIPDAP